MDKIAKKIGLKLLYAFLILFPFGQIIRLEIPWGEKLLAFQPIDIVGGLILIAVILSRPKIPTIFKYIASFLITAVFSLLVSVSIFEFSSLFVGFLYLLRLIIYSGLFVFVWNLEKKEHFYSLLLGLSFAVAFFGWFQYFFYPDFRPLAIWGWDDHLNRLIGSFMDPTFSSILLTFGLILSLNQYLKEKKLTQIILSVFLATTILFTYARAGYVAMVVGVMTLLVLNKKIKIAATLIIGLFISMLLLPRSMGEGVKLERTASIFARVRNYKESLVVISKSPALGIGYNNICLARQKFLGDKNINSHACSGFDASVLTIFSTMGVVGVMSFLTLLWYLFKVKNPKGRMIVFWACLGAILTHSVFVNSLTYPWVMGFLAILFGILYED